MGEPASGAAKPANPLSHQIDCERELEARIGSGKEGVAGVQMGAGRWVEAEEGRKYLGAEKRAVEGEEVGAEQEDYTGEGTAKNDNT